MVRCVQPLRHMSTRRKDPQHEDTGYRDVDVPAEREPTGYQDPRAATENPPAEREDDTADGRKPQSVSNAADQDVEPAHRAPP